MHGEPLPEEHELRLAAEVFLRGPVPVGTRTANSVQIGTEAVARVTAHLASCDRGALDDITAALAWHRRVGTSASRQTVIDTVAAAVAARGPTPGTGHGEDMVDREMQ